MRIRMIHIGGPLDGTIEFEEGCTSSPNDDYMHTLARGTYEFTEGELGKLAMTPAPAAIEAHVLGALAGEDVDMKITMHAYFITSNQITDDIRVVTALYHPEANT